MLVSEWAQARRIWSCEAAPYQAGILDAVAEPDIHTIVIHSDFQRGKTTLLLTIAAWIAQHDADHVCYVTPRQSEVRHIKLDRAAALATDPLVTIIGSDGGYGVSRPLRAILLDEAGKFIAADEEGDVTSHLTSRTMTYRNRLTVIAGSDFRTKRALERSDWRRWSGDRWERHGQSGSVAGFDMTGPTIRPLFR